MLTTLDDLFKLDSQNILNEFVACFVKLSIEARNDKERLEFAREQIKNLQVILESRNRALDVADKKIKELERQKGVKRGAKSSKS